MPGDCFALRPITKNVACTCSERSSSSTCAVYGPGPSSNVSATRPLRAWRDDAPHGSCRAPRRSGPSPWVAVGCGQIADRPGGELGPARSGVHGLRRQRRRSDRSAVGPRRLRRTGRRARSPMPTATSSAAATASSRRRAYMLTRRRRASSASAARRDGARCEASSKPRVDHDEARELRAEHDAVGVADARQRPAARDDQHAGADQEVGERALAAAQRAHDAAEQRDRAQRVERDREQERESGQGAVRRRAQAALGQPGRVDVGAEHRDRRGDRGGEHRAAREQRDVATRVQPGRAEPEQPDGEHAAGEVVDAERHRRPAVRRAVGLRRGARGEAREPERPAGAVGGRSRQRATAEARREGRRDQRRRDRDRGRAERDCQGHVRHA